MTEVVKQKQKVEMIEMPADEPEGMVSKGRVEKVMNGIYWVLMDGNQRSLVVNGAKELLGDFMPKKVVE